MLRSFLLFHLFQKSTPADQYFTCFDQQGAGRAIIILQPAETRASKIAEYKEKFANPYVAASLGMVDDVIDPRETRAKLKDALEILRNKRETRPPKKHGNIPL